ncbi:exosome component 10 [Ischnura elegans]|uniref:exosome component 10 n=1 Tax=Ischnura elegans TaxID=197161 RepID=UPI001ED86921|nr:exosome component 10 [Ischnura elegans]
MANDEETCVNKEAKVEIDGEGDDSNGDEDVLLPGIKSLEQFTQEGFASLMGAIKASNSLPCGNDWDYYSSFPVFQKAIDIKGKKVLKLISMVFQHQGVKGNILRRDLEEKFDLLLDANDMILERVNSTLDELSGIRRNPQPQLIEVTPTAPKPVSGSWNKLQPGSAGRNNAVSPRPLRLLTAKNVQRPQIKFKDKIDNRGLPFEPKIKDKPNSLKPLAIFLEYNAEGEESFNHPYQYELELFTPRESQLVRAEPVMYRPVSETPLVFIEEQGQLEEMVKDIQLQPEIAVDLEHHSYRSFQGFTCLIQISTREKDYIIDALSLRHCLHCLNEVFTNPKIVKVFHGADSDVIWLQRDFSVYLVNMFDTHQAARVLHFAHLSLAFLLKHYCDISVDKRFQLADWRMRPLPEEMINYAREDTHYLLYVYDKMRSDLIAAANGQNNLLKSVIQRSTELCLKKYEKPIFTDDAHLNIVQKTKKLLNNRQMYALKEIAAWRNKVAREEDESYGYVLPNHMLLQISEILPREIQGILACCNPIPPLVRQNLVSIHQIVLRARDQPLVKVVSQEEVELARASAATRSGGLDPLTSPLLCPHDLSHSHDYRDDLSTLLGDSKSSPQSKTESNSCLLKGLPSFEQTKESPAIALKNGAEVELFGYEAFMEEEDSKAAVIKKLKNLQFTSPYQRYKMVKPYMEFLESAEHSSKEPEKEADPEREITDEERINRIKEHFLQLSTNVSRPEKPTESIPKKENQEEILSKQIPKKRKRGKNNHSEVAPSEMVEISDNSDGESPAKIHKSLAVKQEKSGFPQKRMVDNNHHVEAALEASDGESPAKIQKTNPHVKVEAPKKEKVIKEEQPSSSSNKFDYSMVDFNRFQGGSRSNNKDDALKKKEKFCAKVKSKFKWKGRQHNQSMTYKKSQPRR